MLVPVIRSLLDLKTSRHPTQELATLLIVLVMAGLINGALAEEMPLLPPISLHLKNASPPDAFKELARQMGAELRLPVHGDWGPGGLELVDVDEEGHGFWPAAKALYDKTGIAAVPDLGPQGLALVLKRQVQWAWGNRPAAMQGPIVIVAAFVNRDDNIYLISPERRSSNLVVSFHVYADPRLHARAKNFDIKLADAADENGISLIRPADVPPTYLEKTMVDYRATLGSWHQAAFLVCPPGAGHHIARVRGVLPMTVDARTDNWEIDDALHVRQQTRTIGGIAVTITMLVRKGQDYELGLYTERGDSSAAEYQHFENNFESLANGILLIDPAGREWQSKMETSSGTGARMAMSRIFRVAHPAAPVAGKSEKLIWPIPAEARAVSLNVPFEFKDLPMP